MEKKVLFKVKGKGAVSIGHVMFSGSFEPRKQYETTQEIYSGVLAPTGLFEIVQPAAPAPAKQKPEGGQS